VTNNVASGLDGFGNRVSRGGGIDNRISPQLTLNRTYVSGNTAEYVGEFTHPGDTSIKAPLLTTPEFLVPAVSDLISSGTFTSFFAFIHNSTIAENKTNGNGGGLAIQDSCGNGCPTSPVDIKFSTIARNIADQDNSGDASGGGVYRFVIDGSVQITRLKNSIVADNMVGAGSTNPDISGFLFHKDTIMSKTSEPPLSLRRRRRHRNRPVARFTDS
jgi:hypothetical protein